MHKRPSVFEGQKEKSAEAYNIGSLSWHNGQMKFSCISSFTLSGDIGSTISMLLLFHVKNQNLNCFQLLKWSFLLFLWPAIALSPLVSFLFLLAQKLIHIHTRDTKKSHFFGFKKCILAFCMFSCLKWGKSNFRKLPPSPSLYANTILIRVIGDFL